MEEKIILTINGDYVVDKCGQHDTMLCEFKLKTDTRYLNQNAKKTYLCLSVAQ